MSINTNTPGIHLQEFILDGSATPAEKADCLKLLKVVIKNLADPVKAQDPKFRQLRLENERIRQKLARFVQAVNYLKAIGFTEIIENGETLIRIVDSPNIPSMQASFLEVTTALEMVAPANNPTKPLSLSLSSSGSSSASSLLHLEEKKSDDHATSTVRQPPPSRFSEKQKARLLMEQKERDEKNKAKAARKRTSAQIKMDKHVRKNDPNWKPCVSAAAAKAGDSMSTFRDKFGEN